MLSKKVQREGFHRVNPIVGSRRLSVGALVGIQVPKEDGEVVKKTKATIASSFGSTPGVTQGGVTKIRNKTIPIINPMVKTANWAANNTYKKGKLFYLATDFCTSLPKEVSLILKNNSCLQHTVEYFSKYLFYPETSNVKRAA